MSENPTIQAIIARRVETGLADLLLMCYDAGMCAGLGVAHNLAQRETDRALIATIQARWFTELEARQEQDRARAPDWLRALSSEGRP